MSRKTAFICDECGKEYMHRRLTVAAVDGLAETEKPCRAIISCEICQIIQWTSEYVFTNAEWAMISGGPPP